jgi:signal transduction histidine kinase
MKKLLFVICLLVSFSVNAQTTQTNQTQQVQEQVLDSVSIPTDTLLESAPKKSFGSKIGKLFGYNPDEEIENLNNKVKAQRALIDSMVVALNVKPKTLTVTKTVSALSPEAAKSIKRDEKFISDLPKSYTNLDKSEVSKLTQQIDEKIEELIKQRDSILLAGGNTDLIDAKNGIIQSLQREKSVIHLSEESNTLKGENSDLNVQNVDLKEKQSLLKKYLYTSLAILFVLLLIIAVVIQRKKIHVQDGEIVQQLADINKKNNYLEHAARIIRHDMHSGINTYMPRGLSSLEKRIDETKAKELKIDAPLKMIREGLNHTQKVYKSVYEFTNLVKQDVVLETKASDLKSILTDYVSSTAYGNQVQIDELITAEVNPSLFCTAIDNLIRNGLNFNDSENKFVKVYMSNNELVVEDNGRGLSSAKFEKIKNNRESGGLGLSIALAIIEEHGFELNCEQIATGTKMKIKLK